MICWIYCSPGDRSACSLRWGWVRARVSDLVVGQLFGMGNRRQVFVHSEDEVASSVGGHT